jgi:hypothetical protein
MNPQAPVRWEFLEGAASWVSQALGEPEPFLTLVSNSEEAHQAYKRGQLGLDPGLIAILDEDEATFMIAHALVVRKSLKSRDYMRHRPPISFRAYAGPWRPGEKRNLALTLGSLMIWTLVWFSGRFDPWLFAGVFVALLTPHLFSSIRFFGERHFLQALALTRDVDKAESYVRKTLAYRFTKKGTKPLTGWRRALARLAFWMNVPDRQVIQAKPLAL